MSFPLLSKELTEQSARKRTYIVRCIYALLLLIAFSLMYSNYSKNYGDELLGIIGMGGQLFDTIFYCQYWAILLLMPALAANSLTSEKEQGSLTILLLTDIGPWELILQKWLSRIMTVGSFLLLSMPLMGLCYAFGGLEVERLVKGIYVLGLIVLQTAAVAIAASAWCRNSITSLFTTYGFLLVMYVGPILASYGYQGWTGKTRYTEEISTLFWPEKIFTAYQAGSGGDLADLAFASLPIVILIGWSLLFARWALPRRAQLLGPSLLLSLFRRLDGLFERGDAKLGRRRIRINLPDQAPVAWRELNRRSLANWRYLIRFIIPALILFTCLFCFFVAYGDWNLVNYFLQISSLSMLGVTMLLGLVLGSTIIAAERTQQTLDVLLTTPLTARIILLEKLRGLRRITWTIILPALLLMMWVVYIKNIAAYYNKTNIFATLAYFILLPPLFTWFAVAIGLLIRNRNRAMIVALIGGCFWMGSFMLIAAIIFGIFGYSDSSPISVLCYFTPGLLPLINEVETPGYRRFVGGAPLLIGIYIGWHGALWLFLRWWCIRNADRLMRRGAGT